MRPWASPTRVMMKLRRKKKIWMSCALAKASTTMPGREGRGSARPSAPRPVPTLLPVLTVASAARSTWPGLVPWAKAQAVPSC
ncbi:uncharacterized protein ACIBXB_001392 isoform 3-T3 [Morphnus guianensis]